MPRRRLLVSALLICSVLAVPNLVQAQSATPSLGSQMKRDLLDVLKNLPRDQKAIWTSPAHIRSSDWWWIGSVTGATTAFIVTDLETGDFIAKYPDLLKPSQVISQFGAGYTVAAAVTTLYVIGKARKKDRLAETGLLAGEALANSFFVIGAVKLATQRARPDSGDERSQFFVGGNSFPSGHSGNVWSVATVVANEYHDKRWVQVLAYGSAGLISFSRFTAQRHYLSDILVGSAIGFGIGQYVYRAHHIDSTKRGSASAGGTGMWPLISPRVDRAAKGYSIGLTWVY